MLNLTPIYLDTKTDRLVRGVNDIYLITEQNRIITLIKTKRVKGTWKRI